MIDYNIMAHISGPSAIDFIIISLHEGGPVSGKNSFFKEKKKKHNLECLTKEERK